MTSSERSHYGVETKAFSAPRRKLAKLNAKASPARDRTGPLAGAGGLPPFRAARPQPPLPHGRVQNSCGMRLRALLSAPTQRASAALDATRQGEARKQGFVGWGTGHGRGIDRAEDAVSLGGGALTLIGGGAGA